MACLLACLITFGRLAEENELTAVRASGISLIKALWVPPLFTLIMSAALVPFNTELAPWANRSFRTIYENILSADPLINIEAKKFFSIKNIKIFANEVSKEDKKLTNLFVYQTSQSNSPAERIFARKGEIKSQDDSLVLHLETGQLERFDPVDPTKLFHGAFQTYDLSIPFDKTEKATSTRFRNISNIDLKKMILDQKSKNLPAQNLEAEYALRYAIAFAPLALVLMGLPLAAVLKKGGRGFGFGVSLIIIFTYYTLLIFGLTMAEKGVLPPHVSLWIANIVCLAVGMLLVRRMVRQ
jgi:lipopolysaccharide export LptBFGC system permease protein LptF